MTDDDTSKRLKSLFVDVSKLRIDASQIEHIRAITSSPAVLAANASIARNQQLVQSAIGLSASDLAISGERYRAMLGHLPSNDGLTKAITANRLSLSGDTIKGIAEIRKLYVDVSKIRSEDIVRFSRPEKASILDYFAKIKSIDILPATRLFGLDQSAYRMAADLHSPWLDQAKSIASVTHLAELGSIGRAVNLGESYNDIISSALRQSLGDWRDSALPDDFAVRSISERSKIYVDHGLNPDLTDFPEDTFEETLDISKIRGAPLDIAALFGSPVPTEDDAELEAALVRNNQAQDWLQRFEMRIRMFIDERMTDIYGPDWPRSKLPNNMLDKWLEKQSKDPHRERHSRVIAYADFTDYEPIVTRGDVFKEVFRPFFGRVEHFRESMHRLAIPRIEVSHARIITQDEALLFYSEIKRLMTQFIRRH